MDILDARANEVCRRAMAEESNARHHVVIALTGAHAYGFPSPDSDLDLKAIHIEKTERLLGLGRSREVADRLEVIDGVEIDYTSNEIRPALAGILAGNGNYIERVLGELIWATSPEHEALKPLVELMYRGKLWLQRGGNDWTATAFLTSRDTLGLDIKGDNATTEAMVRALPEFATEALSRFAGRRRSGIPFRSRVGFDEGAGNPFPTPGDLSVDAPGYRGARAGCGEKQNDERSNLRGKRTPLLREGSVQWV